jgi:hypothetical protein
MRCVSLLWYNTMAIARFFLNQFVPRDFLLGSLSPGSFAVSSSSSPPCPRESRVLCHF